MYSESDLDNAVAAGVLPQTTVSAFRDYVAANRAAPAVDEEHFRLLSGFNDIFVTIAAALLLAATARIGAWFGESLAAFAGTHAASEGGQLIGGGLLVAAASWALAEYFTRRRRMALPSILLMLAFVGGVAACLIGVPVANGDWIDAQVQPLGETLSRQIGAGIVAVVALLAGVAAWAHWKRFMVPITVAAGALVLTGLAIALLFAFVPGARMLLDWALAAGGVTLFLVAMTWDVSDRERRTRRSDVAFWLHLAAAPLIAHPVFHLLGVFGGEIDSLRAVLVIALYIGFAFVALAVDRRALLVSSLVYVLYALYALFKQTGSVELSASLTALVIGSALLSLSAFWRPMRAQVVRLLGGLGSRLPPLQIATA